MARVRTGGTTTRRWTATAVAGLLGLVAAVGGCGHRGRSDDAFCTQLKVVRDLDEVLAGGDGTRSGQRAGELHELALVAPEPIEPQVTRLAAVTEDLARTMGTVSGADAAASEVFTRRQAELPDITAAGRAVESYAAEHCQVQLNPADEPVTTTTAPPPAPTTTRAPARSSTRAPATTRRPSASTRSTRATSSTRKPSTSRPRATTTTTRRR